MENLLRTLVYDGQVSLTLANTTQLVQEGIRLHNLSKTSAIVFGKALSVMAFMSACLKNPKGDISFSIKSDGTCGEISVSGNYNQRLRGYIANTQAEGDGAEAQKACIGETGSLTVIRDDGYFRPFVGACGFPIGANLDEIFEEYYRISEQLPTRIATTVQINENGDCAFAGVAVLQPLPFADEETLEKVEKYDLNVLLKQAQTSDVFAAVKAAFLTDTAVWEEMESVYKCNCSRAYLQEVLISLGEAQMRQIIKEDGAVRVHCHYCNTDYAFTDADADTMFKKK